MKRRRSGERGRGAKEGAPARATSAPAGRDGFPRFDPATWILAAIVAFLPWVWLAGTRDPGSDAKWPALAWGVVLAALAAAIRRGGDPAPRSRRPDENADGFSPPDRAAVAAFALIAGGLVVSTALSPAIELSWRASLRELVFLVLAAIAATRPRFRFAAALVLGTYAASAAIQAGFTLMQYTKPGEGAAIAGRASMVGTFGNPEYVAGWIAPALAGGVVFAWLGARGGARWAIAAGAAPVAVSIFLGGGRGAALGAIFGVGAAAAVRSLRGGVRARTSDVPSGASDSLAGGVPRAAIFAAIVVAAVAALAAFGMTPEARRQSLVGRLAATFDPAHVPTRHRAGLAAISARLVGENPILGVGPGRFAVAFERERGDAAADEAASGDRVGFATFNELMGDRTASEAHCDPLQWWAEYGLAPFLGLGLALASAFVRLAEPSDPRGGSDDADEAIRLAALAMLATIVFGMFFAFPLHRPARAALFWTLIGLAHARRIPRSEPKP